MSPVLPSAKQLSAKACEANGLNSKALESPVLIDCQSGVCAVLIEDHVGMWPPMKFE
jgi:hypothetical protein